MPLETLRLSPDSVYNDAQALLAQLDRASDYESEGREFESLRARFQPVGACFRRAGSTDNHGPLDFLLPIDTQTPIEVGDWEDNQRVEREVANFKERWPSG